MNYTEAKQDVFISHASTDKRRYVVPLTEALSRHNVTFWLDDTKIKWGENFVIKINEGLRTSQYALVCLSAAFLKRRWPESELGALLSMQNSDGVTRVLPLILNSKEAVLSQYPLLANLAYREFKDPNTIAAEIAELTGKRPDTKEDLVVTVESVNTGKLCRVKVSKRASVEWLSKIAQSGLGVSAKFEIGPNVDFRVRWVLVDVAAEDAWKLMSRNEKRKLYAIVARNGGFRKAYKYHDRLHEIGVKNGTVFHLYAIEDDDFTIEKAAAAS